MITIAIQTAAVPLGLVLLQLLVQRIAREITYDPDRTPVQQLDDELLFGIGDVAGFGLVYVGLGLSAALAFRFSDMQALSTRLAEVDALTSAVVIVLFGTFLAIVAGSLLGWIYSNEAARARRVLSDRGKLKIRDEEGADKLYGDLLRTKARKQRVIMGALGFVSLLPAVLVIVTAIQGPIPPVQVS